MVCNGLELKDARRVSIHAMNVTSKPEVQILGRSASVATSGGSRTEPEVAHSLQFAHCLFASRCLRGA